MLQHLPPNKDIHVVLDYVWTFATGVAQKVETTLLKKLLANRTYSVGCIHLVPNATSSSSDMSDETTQAIKARSMNALHIAVDQPQRTLSDVVTDVAGLNSPPLPEAMTELKEVRLQVHAKHTNSHIPWTDVRDQIPWTKLLRLSMKGQQAQLRFESVVSKLRSLRALQLRAMTSGNGFHQNCPYQRGSSIYSDVNCKSICFYLESCR